MRDAMQAFRAAIMAAMPGADLPEVIEPDRWHRFSTNGRRGDTAGWCKLFDDLRGAVFGCYRQGLSETWSAADRGTMTREQRNELARQVLAATKEREIQRRQQWVENGRRINRLSGELVPLVPGDPVTLYLRHRLALAPGESLQVPAALRLHRRLPYFHDGAVAGRWPAMVAPMLNPAGEVVALHQTWLTPEGHKAPTPGPCKKLTPTAGPLAGACIRLAWPGADGLLGIAEGIETALAARHASGVPTVAAYSAGALATWHWPPELRRLVIFADADPAGAVAAQSLKARAMRAGLSVAVMTPTTPGADWCDVWAQRAAVAVAASEAAA